MRASEPSERNYEIFCQVEFEGGTLRGVAEEHGISPTRVQQIVAEVRVWFVATTPDWVRETDPEKAPLLACRFHERRLQHLYSVAMTAWRSSQTEITTTRVRPGVLGNGEVRVTQRCFGQTRYVALAMQMSRAQIDCAERYNAICDKRDARRANGAAPAEETACAPCAPQTLETSQVVEEALDVVTLSLDDSAPCVDPIALPLSTCAAPHASPTPVRNRKQRRKLERHQRRVAMRKQG